MKSYTHARIHTWREKDQVPLVGTVCYQRLKQRASITSSMSVYFILNLQMWGNTHTHFSTNFKCKGFPLYMPIYESLNLERRICVYRTNYFLQGETPVSLSAVKRSFLCLSSLPTVTFLCCSLCSAIERPPTFLCVCLITNLITNEAEHLSVDPPAMSPDL